MSEPGDDPRPAEPTSRPTVEERPSGRGEPPRRSEPTSQPTVDDRPSGRTLRAVEDALELPRRYWASGEIARGGMGRVVEATDTLLGRVVAIKEVLSTDADMLRRFARETKITARLEHPSIVPVYDAGKTSDGAPFYVMRKVSGQPLEELVSEARTLEQRLALLPNVLAAAQAIAHAHGRGILHRDLKPTNILVGELGETVVIDWGLAKVVDEAEDDGDEPHLPSAHTSFTSLQTRVGTVIGTPGFMSPEQLRGELPDRRTDVYALGATLYHLLASRPPHAASTGEEMMAAASKGPPTPIAQLVPGTPRELATIVDKALSYDPATRYPDAGAFAEDVRRFLAGQLVASHRYSTRERLVRFVRRHKAAVVTVTLAVVALAIVGIVAFSRVVRERDRADDAAALASERQREAELARERERERADQLFLTQARTLISSNPTAAVAMLKELATEPDRWSRLWRHARALAADARTAGVATGLPGPVAPVGLDFSERGDRVVASDRNGDIFVYQLATRAHRILRTQIVAPRVFFVGERHLVAFNPSEAVLVDLGTGTQRPLALPFSPAYVQCTSESVYWLARDNRIWQMPLASPEAPSPLALASPPDHMELSFDARWLALRTPRGLEILDVANPTSPTRIIAPPGFTTYSWAASSRELAVGYDGRVARASFDAPPKFYPIEGPAMGPLALPTLLLVPNVRNTLYVIQGDRVALRDRGLQLTTGLRLGPRTLVVGATAQELLVFDGVHELAVKVPAEGVLRMMASPRSPYVLLATKGSILVWNLDEIVPAPTTIARDLVGFVMAGDDHVLLHKMPFEWHWLDRDGSEHEIPDQPRVALPRITARAGHVVLANTDGTSYLLEREGLRTRELPGKLQAALFHEDGRLLLSTGDGIRELDPRTDEVRTLHSTSKEVTFLDCRGEWRTAFFGDGTLWRWNGRDPEATVRLPRHGPLLQLADGRTIVAQGAQLRTWERDGTLTDLATMPMEIEGVIDAPQGFVVALRDGSHQYISRTGAPISSTPSGTTRLVVASAPELAIYITAAHVPMLVDLTVGLQWPLIRPSLSRPMAHPWISSDARRALALHRGTLVEWTLDLPRDAAETKAWLERMTNASAERGPTTITWH